MAEAEGEDGCRNVRAATKKAEAVVIAERRVSETGWLPGPVRLAATAPEGGEAAPLALPMTAE